MGKVLMKGNEAIGEAAIRAGCLNYFAYPITPQSEVAEYLARRMPEVDRALSALIADLRASGLLDEVLVLVTTECLPRLRARASV